MINSDTSPEEGTYMFKEGAMYPLYIFLGDDILDGDMYIVRNVETEAAYKELSTDLREATKEEIQFYLNRKGNI